MNTMVKTNNLPGLINDFMNLGFEKIFSDDFGTPGILNQTPVNITETPTEYRLEMVAPGREKSDFSVTLEKNILTIQYTKKEEAKDETVKPVRREFRLDSFKRTFSLNEQVNAAGIQAAYQNGILHLLIPKKEIVKAAPTNIEIK
jgi:HSP20 family protein